MDLARLRVSELLRLHRETLAELLVARATGGTLADNSKRSWDVCVGDCDADGIRLQVKARLVDDMTTPSKRRLWPFRTWKFATDRVLDRGEDWTAKLQAVVL